MTAGRAKAKATISTKRLRVAVRLRDWSEWCRQIVRGVQRFAHEEPSWNVIADVGFQSSVTVPPRSGDVVPLDGAIVAVLDEVPAFRRMLAAQTPKLVAVTASIPPKLNAMASVRVDEDKVASAIGRHLLAGGFRRFGYCAAHREGEQDQRAKAVQTFADSVGCPLDIFAGKVDGLDVTMRAVQPWVKKLSGPIGIICWNLNVARNVVNACQKLGRAVPEEVAVIGWDDDVMLAESVQPTLSAAVMPADRLGYEAAKLLNSLMSGAAVPEKPILIEPPPNLLHIRQSTDVSTLKDRDVWLALQYIREHSTEGLKVSQITHALQVSRRKLEQRFKAVTGNTLHDAIIDVRLGQAKQLLLETDWPLERISARVGLATRQTLHNVFIRQEQMTPAEYRRRFGAVQ